jgi:hypothetical protein
MPVSSLACSVLSAAAVPKHSQIHVTCPQQQVPKEISCCQSGTRLHLELLFDQLDWSCSLISWTLALLEHWSLKHQHNQQQQCCHHPFRPTVSDAAAASCRASLVHCCLTAPAWARPSRPSASCWPTPVAQVCVWCHNIRYGYLCK